MMYNPYTLEGKTILITGASSGIGRATAIECSKMGAKCVITGRNEERLQETFDLLEGEGHLQTIADLSTLQGIYSLVEQSPNLNGLVNNAGFTQTLPISFIKEDSLKNIFQVNSVAPILLLKSLLKKKKIVRNASIVFTCSLSGLGRVSVGNSMYAASKGAIHAFSKAAAKEFAEKGIRVNTVCPGMVDTGILNAGVITKEQMLLDQQKYPLGRYGSPNDIAWAIIYLLSNASSWVTGIDLILDGGKMIN